MVLFCSCFLILNSVMSKIKENLIINLINVRLLLASGPQNLDFRQLSFFKRLKFQAKFTTEQNSNCLLFRFWTVFCYLPVVCRIVFFTSFNSNLFCKYEQFTWSIKQQQIVIKIPKLLKMYLCVKFF